MAENEIEMEVMIPNKAVNVRERVARMGSLTERNAMLRKATALLTEERLEIACVDTYGKSTVVAGLPLVAIDQLGARRKAITKGKQMKHLAIRGVVVGLIACAIVLFKVRDSVAIDPIQQLGICVGLVVAIAAIIMIFSIGKVSSSNLTMVTIRSSVDDAKDITFFVDDANFDLFAEALSRSRATDQSVLVDIAKSDTFYSGARCAAVERLSDPGVLADIIENGNNPDVRRAAVGRVTDQSVLVDIAKSDTFYSDVRCAAVERVTDQSVLADIAKNDEAHDVRQAALARITDQGVVADIAKDDNDPDVRKTAEQRLAKICK